MVISKEKLEKITLLKTDDADLIIKINEYLNHKHEYIDSTDVFEDAEGLKETLYQKEQGNASLYLLFSNAEVDLDDLNVYKVENKSLYSNVNIQDMYYSGKKYEAKMKKYETYAENDLFEKLQSVQSVSVVIDVASVSSYPLWDTIMRRRMNSIIRKIDAMDEKDISPTVISEIIRDSKPTNIELDNKYDLDILIVYLKKALEIANVTVYFINSKKTNESIYLTNELIKFVHALKMDKIERYDYIYDTICKDLDEMFSKYGFCNFKENKCVAQRHKTLLSRYPTPKTDGCCFKIVRKCEHNNKDGTCKVKCLSCKLFTCPYLGKLHIGVRVSELILMRAFFNNRQKRFSIYKFYNSKEILLKKIIEQE